MPRENEPSRGISVKANPPVATLKRVMSRRHRVIGFSPQPSLHLSLLFPTPLSFLLLQLVFGAMYAEDPGEPASLVRIFQTSRRCKSKKTRGGGTRGGRGEGGAENREEEERRAVESDGTVKRAEDGRCLVVCRIWVSDLGLRPAVGRLARQETCFLGRLSFPPPSPPLLSSVLSSRSLSLRSSR